MLKVDATDQRSVKMVRHEADLVVGGGLAGSCCAITAARAGIRVVLVQDRPVLGGNSSSEVRLWVLGATSHMGNNNRWAREGGVIDEVLAENVYRNPEGNPIIFDTILLEKVVGEPNITLLLNTAAYEVKKSAPDRIESVRAFCSQNATQYELSAPYFCDASGDGIVGFLAGAAFRMGAESREEFGEKFAPSEEYGELLGHTIYFYSKDTGRPVRFVPPAYALADITQIPRYRSFNAQDFGCQLWWIEYGGRLDTVHQTETIKWELWKVVYGVWNYIKNSGKFPEAENLTLEWVGNIPGKRESRRFEGDYMMRQQDIVAQRPFEDAVAFGGWSIDLHPADGVFSEKPGCNQWHAKGIYQIPFRCLYSRNLENLFLAGRIISASHVAFGSTRVMGTCAHGGQAVGMAAALGTHRHWRIRDFNQPGPLRTLQNELLKTGHHLPNVALEDPRNLAASARITASSEWTLDEIPFDGPWVALEYSSAQMLPLSPGPLPAVTLQVKAAGATELTVEWRISSKPFNHTPDVTLGSQTFALSKGENLVSFRPDARIDSAGYGFVCLMKNELVSVRSSQLRVTGLLSVFNKVNKAVSNYGVQTPPEDIGVESFEFWCPHRRPAGHNLALKIEPSLRAYAPRNASNGVFRPTVGTNAWAAHPDDRHPKLYLDWETPQTIREVILGFDADYDHPMESSLLGHPESTMPFCVRHYRICNDQGEMVFEKKDNHQSINKVVFDPPLVTHRLVLEPTHPSGHVPAALFEVLVY
ncbi:MAG: FAD-dependent oxidoreductase [Ferruginibacter sp.]|nr:FAD-dependent oxidoreductase [Cytophagales bacterium]